MKSTETRPGRNSKHVTKPLHGLWRYPSAMRWFSQLVKLWVVAGCLAAVGSAQSSVSVDTTAATSAPSLSMSTAITSQTMQSTPNETSGQVSTQSPARSASELQSPRSASPPASIASSTPKVHLVKAGVGGFVFEPDQLTNVSVGDVVTFEFYPPDHSVARAEFGSACVPYEYTGKSKVGFWSGTQWVNTTSEITHWNLTINSTEPIFYYCAAPDSCKGKHMVGVINPNTTQTLDAQMLAAARADFQVAPGEPIPREGSGLEQASAQRPSKLSTGDIVGIAVGCVAFLIICALLLWYAVRQRWLNGELPPEASITTTNQSFVWPMWHSSTGLSSRPQETSIAPVELPGQGPVEISKY